MASPSRPSHNALLSNGLVYQGHRFASVTDLYSKFEKEVAVDLATFRNRVWAIQSNSPESLSERLDDCIRLSIEDYKRHYGVRRSTSSIDGQTTDLAEFYANGLTSSVSYSTFRARIRGQERRGCEISSEMARQAAELDNSNWRRGWGASRLSIFTHNGIIYPTYKEFAHRHGRSDDVKLIAARLKRGADPESALEPKISRGGGFIYLVKQKSTGLEYVGLTTLTPAERWGWHMRSARSGSPYPLHKAIAESGEDDFEHTVLEKDVETEDELIDLEVAHIEDRNTIYPAGLNGNKGGAIGGGRPKPCKYKGEEFISIQDRNRILGKRFKIPPYVVQNRIKGNLPLEAPARAVSNEQLSDPDYQRQWRKVLRRADRGEIDLYPPWRSSNNWLQDVCPQDHNGKHLVHIDSDRPFQPDNVKWMSEQEKIAHTHGTTITANGKVYGSYTELAKDVGLSVSTLKYRVLQQGMTPEEAVSNLASATAAKPVLFENEEFPSIQEAARVLSKRHDVSKEKARDRVRRNVPLSRWPEIIKM